MSSSVARKITPHDLCQPKIKIGVEKLTYSHESQSMHGDSNVIYMVTYNATQTFDQGGKPRDKDNDK